MLDKDGNKNYIKPLDGLRVIALLGVSFYHLLSIFFPSGYLGVVIFFTLAGFLSMQAIINRETKSYTIAESLSKIWDKICKLMPALLLVILLVSIVMTLYFKNFLKSYPWEAISSILFVNNYAQIFNHESYFDAMNSMKPLTHLWALSLEMQFYIIFFLFAYTFYKKGNKAKFSIILVVIYIISQAITFSLLMKEEDLTRIYYGFDTRINTFIIGMISALFVSYLGKRKINSLVLKVIEPLFLIATIIFMFIPYNTDKSTVIMLIVYSIISAAFFIPLSYEHFYKDEKTLVYKFLSSKVMHIITKRSYIIYLVHYPVAIFANRLLAHTKVNIYLYAVILIPLIILISEIIYRIYEIVFVKNAKTKLFYISIVLLILMIVGLTCYDTKYKNYYEELVAKENESFDADMESDISTIENNEMTFKVSDDIDIKNLDMTKPEEFRIMKTLQYINKINTEIGMGATLSQETYMKYRNMKITLIGDSVAECAKEGLSLYFPDSYIDAVPNRQFNKALSVFNSLKEKHGAVGDVVVVSLGTNSTHDINVEHLESVYYAAEGRPVVFLTVAVPVPYEEQKRNNVITKFVETHANCFLADWYSIMKTHSECFQEDSTHPKATGIFAYAQIVFNTCVYALEHNGEVKVINNDFSYLSNATIGEIVSFGNYNIDKENEKKPIEWIVIDKNKDIHAMMLLSKYAIDCKKYNLTYNGIDWKRSKVREWLNESFYDDAFSDEEKEYIRQRDIYNNENPTYKTSSGEDTKDNVFLLSYKEITKYLDQDTLKCEATDYAIRNGVYVESGDKYCDWWTRTSGDIGNNVMYVSNEGEIVMEGDYCTTDDFGIRPAMYIRYE